MTSRQTVNTPVNRVPSPYDTPFTSPYGQGAPVRTPDRYDITDEAVRLAEDLSARMQAVLDLHRTMMATGPVYGELYCAECDKPVPCATVRRLTGDPA